MKKRIRLLVPEKKGVNKRIGEAVEAGHGVLEHTRIVRPMRGVTVMEITVSCEPPAMAATVIQSLGHLRSITVVAVEDVIEADSPRARGGQHG